MTRPRVMTTYVLILAALCASTLPVSAQFSLVSVEQEIEIGRETNAEVRKQVPEVRDSQVTAYIRNIGERLARQASGPKYPYTFSMADYREINAFALPGGPIWIHRGVLHAATNESQVAGVLAHEIAHVDLRHSAEQMGNVGAANMGLTLAYVLLGRQPGNVEALAVNLAGGAVFAKFSRDHEREADSMAVAYLTEARIDPTGLTNMFRRLQQLQQREPSKVELWFSSHPMPAERIDNTGRYINTTPGASAMVRNGRSDLDAFRTLQARLRALPDAPKDVQAN